MEDQATETQDLTVKLFQNTQGSIAGHSGVH